MNDKEQFLKDIDCIKHSNWNSLDNDKKYLCNKWERFVSIMKNELNLSYWLDYYEKLFEQHFQPENDFLQYIAAMPRELLEENTDTLLKWLEALGNKGVKHLNEARIIVLGEKGAGKTSLARRLIDPKADMPDDRESTEGVDITSFQLKDVNEEIPNDKNANVHIWDFAGHSITHAAHRCFLSERCVYIILFDARAEGRNRLIYWLNHVRDYGRNSKVYVLVNKRDDNKPDIQENYIKKHYSNHNCDFHYFSIRDDIKALENFRYEVALYIGSNPAWGQNMPSNYFDAKEILLSTFGNTHDYITLNDFLHIVPEGDNAMLSSLHALGICLHYNDIDDLKTLVLNPKWITTGIYKIINWLKNEQERYQLRIEDFSVIFEGFLNRYPVEKHQFLYKLMKKYELAYEDINKKILIVPHCLKKDQPSEDEFPIFPLGKRLCTNFYAKQKDDKTPMPFPSEIMPRIIIRRSNEASSEYSKVWRYGAILYYSIKQDKSKNTYALLLQKDSVLSLYVAGEERQRYHDLLRGTILDIIDDYTSFIGNTPEITYELVDNPDVMYPENYLITLAKKGIEIYNDQARDKTIDIFRNIEQYRINIINPIINIYNNSNVINFNENKIMLENHLKEISQFLEKSDQQENIEINEAIKQLSECKTEQQYLNNKGLQGILRKIRDQLADDNSTFNKTIKAIKNGAIIIKEIIKICQQIT